MWRPPKNNNESTIRNFKCYAQQNVNKMCGLDSRQSYLSTVYFLSLCIQNSACCLHSAEHQFWNSIWLICCCSWEVLTLGFILYPYDNEHVIWGPPKENNKSTIWNFKICAQQNVNKIQSFGRTFITKCGLDSQRSYLSTVYFLSLCMQNSACC